MAKMKRRSVARRPTCDERRRKANGEVMTPFSLVKEICSHFPDDVWSVGKTCLEPACGNGNFIVEALRRKMRIGKCAPIDALMDAYAVDIKADNVAVTRWRALKVTGMLANSVAKRVVRQRLRCGNALTDRLDDVTYWYNEQDLLIDEISVLNKPYFSRGYYLL